MVSRLLKRCCSVLAQTGASSGQPTSLLPVFCPRHPVPLRRRNSTQGLAICTAKCLRVSWMSYASWKTPSLYHVQRFSCPTGYIVLIDNPRITHWCCLTVWIPVSDTTIRSEKDAGRPFQGFLPFSSTVVIVLSISA